MDIVLSSIIGAVGVLVGAIGAYYAYRAVSPKRAEMTKYGKSLEVFESRIALLHGLQRQYDDARSGDLIWGQCVSCKSYSDALQGIVLRAAADDIGFRFIFNANTPTKDDMAALFRPIRRAEIRLGNENDISVQGLSEREVIVSLPGINDYFGVCIRHPPAVRYIRRQFEQHWLSATVIGCTDGQVP